MRRTPTIQHDGAEDFEVLGQVTKHWRDELTGRRFLRGVVSGIAEDADGERVSARAIAKMAATTLVGGAVKATASHDQDWLTEFGDVVALKHDAEHNELAVDVALPPEGEDAIADKAFRRAQKGDLGWSIGGKLQKSFFELVPDQVGKGGAPKRRHVLDDIKLAHVMLTKKPAYRGSFAQAVAKTAKLDDAPRFDDVDFFDEPDAAEAQEATAILKRASDDLEAQVAKAKTAPAPDDEAPEAGKDSAAADSPAADADPDQDADVPTAGAGDTAPDDGPGAPTDAEAATNLPDGDGARHLACPNCGTEFAAPLPDDLQPGQMAEKKDDEDTSPSAADNDTAKTTTNKEITMGKPLIESLAAIRALADGGAPEVEKSTVEPTDVEKAATAAATDEATDVEKMIAASHRLSIEATESLAEGVTGALASVQKTLGEITAQLAELPQGRRSVARSGGDGIAKTERDTEGNVVEKAAEIPDDAPLSELSREQLNQLSEHEIAKRADSPVEVAKAINYRNRGIR